MMNDDQIKHIAKIQQLNDRLRTTLAGGMIIFTGRLAQMKDGRGVALQHRVLAEVRRFDDWTSGDDPHNEHDFGLVEVDEQRFYFKIDYYDLDLAYLSPDPANPAVTKRVMSIFFAEDY